MAAKKGATYRIDHARPVADQMRALEEQAASAGVYDEYLAALKGVLERVQTAPLEWGDPEWRTQKQGGYVCHGILSPLLVFFVVYEVERSVCILKVLPLPGSPLE